MPAGRKKISRRKPGDKSPPKNYFNEATQEAIIDYQKEEDYKKRSEIYRTRILPAFDTLINNLINVYGFQVLYENKQDLKNECLEFLYTVICKFNADKGSKAFSYFNVVAQHWLTIRSKQNMKAIQIHVSIDDKDNISPTEYEKIENYKIIPSCEDVVSEEETRANLLKMLAELSTTARTENESATVDAITLLFENIDQIDFLNKRATMLYLREITQLSSKQLSLVLSSLKKQYRELKKNEEFRTS